MEFLVHNISHSDLVVELSFTDEVEEDRGFVPPSPSSTTSSSTHKRHPLTSSEGIIIPQSVLARPKFSLFQQISQEIMNRVEQLRLADLNPSLLDISSESRMSTTTTTTWKVKCDTTQSPIGFKLDVNPISISNLEDFQIRGGLETIQWIEKHWKQKASFSITAVYFPLVALLIPKWLDVLKEFNSESSKQIIYFISGAGIPRNIHHSIQGNSTETTAKLMTFFINQYYPHIQVFQVHSGSNIFRYDDNVQFMTRELRPRLEAHREELVNKCGETWKSHFHVTIAYTDGPPARLSALNASLRIYRPSYLHLWQVKTFWHEKKLSMEDVDFHSFENIEVSPCVFYLETDKMTQTLVKEMQFFRDQFFEAEGKGEIENFWLRKSRKPVLAILLIEKKNPQTGETKIIIHRGMNCEVSMPTGSLCAERNAIGSALARDPTLRRRDLKMIGVLGLNLGGGGPNRSRSTSSTGVVQQSQQSFQPSSPSLSLSPSPSPSPLRQSTNTSVIEVEVNRNLTSPRKPKRPRTFSCDESFLEQQQVQVPSNEEEDRNPLAPCGACKEWLLKIAEANPSFRVVTFENARCRNVYTTQIM
jgi:cytidine deaminase